MEKPKIQKKKQTRNSYCGVTGCSNTSILHPDMKFFRLPDAPERKAHWLKLISGPYDPTSKRCVCEKHFELKYLNFNGKRRILRLSAVPSLFLPETGPCIMNTNAIAPRVVNNTSTKRKSSKENDDHKPEKRVKIAELESATVSRSLEVEKQHMVFIDTQHDNKQPDGFVKITGEPKLIGIEVEENDEEESAEDKEDTLINSQKDYVSEEDFTESQLNFKNAITNRKYRLPFKMFALQLYLKNVNPYRILQSTFNLPRISTLYRLYIPLSTRVSHDMFKALKMKVVRMTTAEKQCVLCIGTIPLTSKIDYDAKADRIIGLHEVGGFQTLMPATHALVISVRGLFHSWKQAVAFSFINCFHKEKKSKYFINQIICDIFKLGLNVRAYMTDLQSDLVTHGYESIVTPKTPNLVFKKRNIYYFYDPIHIMKHIRDAFLIQAKSKHWQYIKECYEHDCQKKSLRLAPKLTAAHINPVKDAIDDLKLTAEVFSRATAVAISTYVDLKLMDDDAKHTVQWVLTMSKLLDLLNFSSINPPDNKNAVFQGETVQVDFLTNMLQESLKTTLLFDEQNKDKNIKILIKALKVSIKALLSLYGELTAENCWFPVVGLSLDCLDNFFDKVRQKYGMKPTANEMRYCITKFPIFNMFQYSLNKRTSNNLENFMMQARDMADIDMYEEEITEPYVDELAGASAELSAIEMLEDNRLEHVALYLLYKGYQQHSNCTYMTEYSSRSDIIGCEFRTNDDTRLKLLPSDFVEFVKQMELRFQEYFKEENSLLRYSIVGLLVLSSKVTFNTPCNCFPLTYIKRLFLRIRFEFLMRHNNKLYQGMENSLQFDEDTQTFDIGPL